MDSAVGKLSGCDVATRQLTRDLGVRVLAGILQWGSNVPEVVPPAEDEVCLCVESGANLPQPTVTAATLQTVLVPEEVQRL